MTATIDFTADAFDTALTSLLADILPVGTPVVRGQVNRVPQVNGDDFVVFWPLNRLRLATNVDTWSGVNPTTLAHAEAVKVTVQIDVHGPLSGDNTTRISTLLRDDYACQFLAALGVPMQPLEADDGRQIPFINGESQYEDRFVIQASFQANVTVSTGQQFAATLAAGIISVDATYPP